MSELVFLKAQHGLIPASETAAEWLKRKKLGSRILVEAREMRNAAFHAKFFALLHLAYDHWSEAVHALEYKGEPVLPEFERFRKDVIILASFYHSVINIKGEVRIEADSLKWASMSEETFTKLYDATIRVLLRRVFNGTLCPTWSEEQLRSVAEQILEFAD